MFLAGNFDDDTSRAQLCSQPTQTRAEQAKATGQMMYRRVIALFDNRPNEMLDQELLFCAGA
jgi:hypothetical protein